MAKKKKTILGILVLLALILGGCSVNAPAETQATTTPAEKGGYVLTVNGATVTVLAEEGSKQVCYVSADGSNTIDLYTSPTEMMVVDTTDGVTRYYTEKLEATSQAFENPITAICGIFSELEFEPAADNKNILVATQVYQVDTTQAIAYRCYDVGITWVDGQKYEFQYFEFADGSVLVSAYAPDEVNPYFTENCKWKFDVENLVLYHEETGETIEIVVYGMTEGESSAMVDEQDRTYETQTATVYLELDEAENPISLRYENQGATLAYRFVYDFAIEPPVVESAWLTMTSEEAQQVLMLISMLENLI